MIYLPVTLLLFFPFIWLAITTDVEVAVAKLGFSPGFALCGLFALLLT